MTSKDRSELKSYANSMESIGQVGKSGITDNLVKQTNDALEARELIKITVLETAPDSVNNIGIELSNKTNSELVQAIGRKIILYRKNEKESKYNI